jgi:ABC-type dipeptide/oligopeptide/nickel transport system permease component
VQYGIFLQRALAGDLGRSIYTHEPALSEALNGLKYSALIAVPAFVITFFLGLAMGIVSAIKYRSPLDQVTMLLSVVGVSLPSFWIALIFIAVFSVELRWLPAMGAGGIAHTILPSLTLAILMLPLMARSSRSCMLDILSEDYIRTARSKGLGEKIVILKHALRNALLPVVTIGGIQLGMLIGGAITTETVFSWPGIGRFLVQAIATRDYPGIQAGIFVLVIVISFLNFIVDLSYGLLDPRLSAR